MSDQYKIGIIGAGNIVESSHLPVLQNLPNAQVAWIYDTNSDRINLLSAMYKVQGLNQTWQDGLREIDVCLITIPYGVRQPYYEACSSLGKSVYVEKPFALSIAEHNHISEQFKPFQLAVGFQRRCYKIVYQLRQLIQSGIFGKLKSIEFVQGYFSLKGGRGYLSDAKLSGGGVIIESAIHSFDQILQITGASDVEVEQVQYVQKNGIDYDSVSTSVLVTPAGPVTVTAKISTLRNLSNGTVLVFDNATVHCRFSADSALRVFSHSGAELSFNLEAITGSTHQLAETIGSSFYYFWKMFLDAIHNQSPNFTSAVSSVLTTKWMEKIYARINQ